MKGEKRNFASFQNGSTQKKKAYKQVGDIELVTKFDGGHSEDARTGRRERIQVLAIRPKGETDFKVVLCFFFFLNWSSE